MMGIEDYSNVWELWYMTGSDFKESRMVDNDSMTV
jgi:hypothetical protein